MGEPEMELRGGAHNVYHHQFNYSLTRFSHNNGTHRAVWQGDCLRFRVSDTHE